MEEKLNDQMLIRRGKLEKIAALGFEPYGGKYECTHHSEDIHADAAALEASGEHVKVAGRIMIIRGHGKTAFCTLRDEKGDIQLYFRKDTVSENEWNLFKLVDMGDILGVEGTVFTTHTGETTIRVLHFTMLSKSLRPLPEKWHGLTDKEQRYRQRYLDLIANPDVRKNIHQEGEYAPGYPELVYHTRFPRSGNAGSSAALRRCECKTFHDAFQRAGYDHVPPHCAGTLFKETSCRRV